MLGFIRALYESSEIRVRGCAGTSTTSPTIKLMRGLRQGCPLSPILFDIFINDLYGRPDVIRTFTPSESIGVEVPGVSVEEEGRLTGLLFADDLVAIDGDRIRLQRHADVISRWCGWLIGGRCGWALRSVASRV